MTILAKCPVDRFCRPFLSEVHFVSGGNRSGMGDGINHSVHPSRPLSNSDALPARDVGPTNLQLRPNMRVTRETPIDPSSIDNEGGKVVAVAGNTKIVYYGTPVPPLPHVGACRQDGQIYQGRGDRFDGYP